MANQMSVKKALKELSDKAKTFSSAIERVCRITHRWWDNQLLMLEEQQAEESDSFFLEKRLESLESMFQNLLWKLDGFKDKALQEKIEEEVMQPLNELRQSLFPGFTPKE